MSEQRTASSQEQADIPPYLQDLHCFTETNGVITTTMFDVPGYRVVKVLGAVYGLTVRSRNWAASLGMVLKSIAGGELKWFTNMVFFFLLSFPSSFLLLCPPVNERKMLTEIAVYCSQRRHHAHRLRDAEPRRERRHLPALRRRLARGLRPGVRLRDGCHHREDRCQCRGTPAADQEVMAIHRPPGQLLVVLNDTLYNLSHKQY